MDSQETVKNTLTIEMIRAGVRAFNDWSYDSEEVAALVAAIYYACEEARVRRTLAE